MSILDEFQIEVAGLSGDIVFDKTGARKYFSLEIIEATNDGFRKLGTWDTERGVKHARNLTQLQMESSKAIVNKTLRVVSKIVS